MDYYLEVHTPHTHKVLCYIHTVLFILKACDSGGGGGGVATFTLEKIAFYAASIYLQRT